MSNLLNNHKETKANCSKLRILIISPFPPPLGGMAIQARKLFDNLTLEGLYPLACNVNADFPSQFDFLSKIPGLRTIVRTFFIIYDISNKLSKIDVVYFITAFKNFFLWVTFPVLIFMKFYNKKVILSARGGAAEDFFKRWKFLGKITLRLVHEITVPSEFLKKAIQKTLGYSPVIVPNIADTAQFTYKPRKEIQPKLIVTRHLSKLYNIECIIRAFRLIKQQYPSAQLTIAGGGPEEDNLKSLVNSLKLKDVIFLGYINHKELPELYGQNDIFVNASNVDNFPGAIIEAFASGLPVITTKAGGIPYIVEDGRTGFLIELNDHQQMAEKVFFILKHPELVFTITENAKKECEKYTWDKVKIKFFDVCSNVSISMNTEKQIPTKE